MSQPSSEPEKYTIDEMMDRLKTRDSSEKQPELVIRSDGSQAMKVKKRKRRSKQAVKEEIKRNKRIQIMQIAGFVVVFILLSLTAGIAIINANSKGFRESLVLKLEATSGAEVKLDQFRMNPLAAHAASASLTWPAGNALGSMELRTVSARIAPSSFIGRTFGGEEIVAVAGKLKLRTPVPTALARQVPKPDGGLPVNFSRYSIPALDISCGEIGSLVNAEVSLYPSDVAGQAEIRLRGGSLQFANWPPMSLDRAYIKVKGSDLQIQSMRFEMPETANPRMAGGSIDFSGSLSSPNLGNPQILAAKLEAFALPYLLGVDLGRFFLGGVNTKDTPQSNFLSFDTDSPEKALLELDLTNAPESKIDLAGFKFLEMLAIAFDDRWYEFPNFDDEIAMVVKRADGKVTLTEINLVNRGRMAVRGAVTDGVGGRISGKLRIGIPETQISATKDKRLEQMFGQVREGYRWVDLEIGGTAALPEDDFRALYMEVSAPGEAGIGEGVAPDSFDDLIEGE